MSVLALSASILALTATVSAFPWQQKRQDGACSTFTSCTATVTSYLPIITQIPYCNGNICPTNTVISQGQPVTTSSLLSSLTSGSVGQVFGGTTVQNNGAGATNIGFSSFTLCESDCDVAGNTYPSGTVFFSSSSLVPGFATTVVGGQTLTDTTGFVTTPTPVVQNYFSTVVGGNTITDGSQPVTTTSRGNDGISTTVIQPGSQLVIPTDPATSTLITPNSPTPSTVTVVVGNPNGFPVTSTIQSDAVGTPLSATVQPTFSSFPGEGQSTAIVGDPNNGVLTTATTNDSEPTSSTTPTVTLPQTTTTVSPSTVTTPATGNPNNNSGGTITPDPAGSQSIVTDNGPMTSNTAIVGPPQDNTSTSDAPQSTTSQGPAGSGDPGNNAGTTSDSGATTSVSSATETTPNSDGSGTSSAAPTSNGVVSTTSDTPVQSTPSSTDVTNQPTLSTGTSDSGSPTGTGGPGNNVGTTTDTDPTVTPSFTTSPAASPTTITDFPPSTTTVVEPTDRPSLTSTSDATTVQPSSNTDTRVTSTSTGTGGPGNNVGTTTSTDSNITPSFATSPPASPTTITDFPPTTTTEATTVIEPTVTSGSGTATTATSSSTAIPCNDSATCRGVGLDLCLDLQGIIVDGTSNTGVCVGLQPSISLSDVVTVSGIATATLPVSLTSNLSPAVNVITSVIDGVTSRITILPTLTSALPILTALPTGSTLSTTPCKDSADCARAGLGLCLRVANLAATEDGICLNFNPLASLTGSLSVTGIANTGLSLTVTGLPTQVTSLLGGSTPSGTLPIATSIPTGFSQTTTACKTSEDCSDLQLGICLRVPGLADSDDGVCLTPSAASLTLSVSAPIATLTVPVTADFSAASPVVSPVASLLTTVLSGVTRVVRLPSQASGAVPTGVQCQDDTQCTGLQVCLKLPPLVSTDAGVCVDLAGPDLLGVSATVSALPLTPSVEFTVFPTGTSNGFTVNTGTPVVGSALPILTALPSGVATTNQGCTTSEQCQLLSLGLCFRAPGLADTADGVCVQYTPTLGVSVSAPILTATLDATLSVLPTGAVPSVVGGVTSIVGNIPGASTVVPVVTSILSTDLASAVTGIPCGVEGASCGVAGLQTCVRVSPITEDFVGVCVDLSATDLAAATATVSVLGVSITPSVTITNPIPTVVSAVTSAASPLDFALTPLVAAASNVLPELFGATTSSTSPGFVTPTAIAPIPQNGAAITSGTQAQPTGAYLTPPVNGIRCTGDQDCANANVAGLCANIGAYIGLGAGVGICTGVSLTSTGPVIGLSTSLGVSLPTAIPSTASLTASATVSVPILGSDLPSTLITLTRGDTPTLTATFTAPTVVPTTVIGAPCTSNADCGSGSTCSGFLAAVPGLSALTPGRCT